MTISSACYFCCTSRHVPPAFSCFPLPADSCQPGNLRRNSPGFVFGSPVSFQFSKIFHLCGWIVMYDPTHHLHSQNLRLRAFAVAIASAFCSFGGELLMQGHICITASCMQIWPCMSNRTGGKYSESLQKSEIDDSISPVSFRDGFLGQRHHRFWIMSATVCLALTIRSGSCGADLRMTYDTAIIVS